MENGATETEAIDVEGAEKTEEKILPVEPALAAHDTPHAMVPPDEAALSDRELESARLFACGLDAHGVAEKLGIGTKTVDSHRASIYKKTLARGIADVTRWCLTWGFIRLDGTTT